jgi:hypothetical protein
MVVTLTILFDCGVGIYQGESGSRNILGANRVSTNSCTIAETVSTGRKGCPLRAAKRSLPGWRVAKTADRAARRRSVSSAQRPGGTARVFVNRSRINRMPALHDFPAGPLQHGEKVLVAKTAAVMPIGRWRHKIGRILRQD